MPKQFSTYVHGIDMPTLFLRIIDELRKTPVTLTLICVLSWIVYGLMTDHVGIREFNELKKQMTGVQFTLQHDHIDTRLHQNESEIFNLTQHVADEKSKGHEVDSLYSIRINDLTNQGTELRRQIDALDRTGVPVMPNAMQ